MFKKRKLTASLAIALTVITIGGTNIYANTFNSVVNKHLLDVREDNSRASASTEEVSLPVSGTTYYGKTEIETNTITNKAIAKSHVRTNKSVPTGYMGVHTAIYRSGTGTAIQSSSWSYNSSSGSKHSVSTTLNNPKAGNYQARGTMKGYNTSNGGYDGKTLTTSPYLSYKNMPLTISEEELQERIMMYETKDMIAAEGVNGEVGYIYLEDMGVYENPSSPEEAIKMQEELISRYGSYRYINVYDTDGNIIDQFKIEIC